MVAPTVGMLTDALASGALPGDLADVEVLLKKEHGDDMVGVARLRLHRSEPVCNVTGWVGTDLLPGTLDDLVHAVGTGQHKRILPCNTCAPMGSPLEDLYATLVDAAALQRRANQINATLGDLPTVSGDLPPATATQLIEVRMDIEFSGMHGVPPAQADFAGLDAPLRSWWEHTQRGWAHQLDQLTALHRTPANGWDGPLVMVTPRHEAVPGTHEAPSYLPVTHPPLRQAVACAPYVGDITRPGLRTSPVLAVPARAHLEQPAVWLSLGPPVTGTRLRDLLAACSAAFAGSAVVDDGLAAAVRTSVLHD